MRRREFTAGLGASLAAPLAARAQQPPVPVIGFLSSGSPGPFAQMLAAFHHGLKVGGYVVGENVAIEYRWAEGQYDRLSTLAADLVRRRVAVIAATGGTRPHALRKPPPRRSQFYLWPPTRSATALWPASIAQVAMSRG
jgi:putative tryptophan/tyrosine transport system substrate-binding protein